MLTLILRLLKIAMVGCALGVGLVVAVVRADPLPVDALEGLGLCHVPCWIGIEPGRTAFAAVPSTVSHHLPGRRYQVRGPRSFFIDPSLDGHAVTIDEDAGLVHSIRLNNSLPLWRLLLLFGEPACYSRLGQPGVINIHWQVNGIYIMSHFGAGEWNPEWHSAVLVLTRRSKDPCQDLHPWRGMAIFSRSRT